MVLLLWVCGKIGEDEEGGVFGFVLEIEDGDEVKDKIVAWQ